ncbi:hypothetical protein BDW59DRAFT_137342 [Aspergillus cavernicola]|uniref:Secreted protein n=1 Tax=Aspergillus cavernicola TaxID=176166 RepID=A0ABR4J5F4_9EURO
MLVSQVVPARRSGSTMFWMRGPLSRVYKWWVPSLKECRDTSHLGLFRINFVASSTSFPQKPSITGLQHEAPTCHHLFQLLRRRSFGSGP